MKKFIATLLVFLLATISVVAIAEVDLSSYTDAELHELFTQINSELYSRCYDKEKGKAVCDAFILNMQELGHSLEYLSESNDLFTLFDTRPDSFKIVFAMNGGYKILPPDNFAANNESYIRDCMVALAMALAEVEGVEIFYNEIDTAMRASMKAFPDGYFKDNICISWNNVYGYQWYIAGRNGTTLVCAC